MRSRIRLVSVALATLVGAVAVILLSPLLLVLVQRLYGFDWAALSDVGQSYTGIATVLSVVAVSGAIYSVVIQTRNSASQLRQTTREMQFMLVRMAIDNEDLARLHMSDGAITKARHERFTEGAYMTFTFRYIEYDFLGGELSEKGLRHMLANEIFDSPAFRRRWRQIEPLWRGNRLGRNELLFAKILSEECGRAEVAT